MNKIIEYLRGDRHMVDAHNVEKYPPVEQPPPGEKFKLKAEHLPTPEPYPPTRQLRALDAATGLVLGAIVALILILVF
jgi:hypothetical protein